MAKAERRVLFGEVDAMASAAQRTVQRIQKKKIQRKKGKRTMCEYCRETNGRHDSRCPLARYPEPIEKCMFCGAAIYEGERFEDTIYGVVCEKCTEELDEELDERIDRIRKGGAIKWIKTSTSTK